MAEKRAQPPQEISQRCAGNGFPTGRAARCLQVFNVDELSAFLDTAKRPGNETTLGFAMRLHAAGTRRPLAWPVMAWEEQLDWLSHVFPAFATLVESSIRPSVRTQLQGGLPRPMPIMVTSNGSQELITFLESLARTLDVPSLRLDPLKPSQQPSALFTTLAFGTATHAAVANPIGLLRCEADGPKSEVQALQRITALLQVDRAQSAHDPQVPDVRFNASCVRWFIECRDLTRIPTTLLNECHVVDGVPRRSR